MHRFPISTGLLVARIKAGLADSGDLITEGVKVYGKLPDVSKRTTRMVTLRNDSGPQKYVLSRRRYGVNVYAESDVNAEKLANLVMAVMYDAVDGDIPLVDELSGPYEVTDENPVIVGSVPLSQYFFSCRVSVRSV